MLYSSCEIYNFKHRSQNALNRGMYSTFRVFSVDTEAHWPSSKKVHKDPPKTDYIQATISIVDSLFILTAPFCFTSTLAIHKTAALPKWETRSILFYPTILFFLVSLVPKHILYTPIHTHRRMQYTYWSYEPIYVKFPKYGAPVLYTYANWSWLLQW